MSEKKPTTEELAQRIDQLLVILKDIEEDLADISNHLKVAESPTPKVAPAVTVPSTPSPSIKMRSVADVRTMFTEELENMLFFEETGKFIIIKPRQYLGSENFAKIASTVRSAGGEYISAGKESHFRVPRELR
jgi:hypothetical protein